MNEPIKEIMYGVTDFARMRNPKHPAYFVDHTDFIRELEKTSYAMFLRPRRFGKSLMCAVLKAYYAVQYAGRFNEFFGDLKIGKNPTEEHNQYLVLDFNFSMVAKTDESVERSFNDICCTRIDKFVADNASRFAPGLPEQIADKADCHSKLSELCLRLQDLDHPVKLYVIIDEYDNFTNTILADSRSRYEALCHGDGFFKQFFTVLKAATTGVDAPISRLFITGVSPVTMDDVTSGFNIGTNISMHPEFSEVAGFTQDDLKEMLEYYRENAGFEFDPEKVRRDISEWYDHYVFSQDRKADGTEVKSVANSTLVLGFMQYFLQTHQYLRDFIDENLRTDYRKIRHIITENRKINGNFHRLEEIIEKQGCTAALVKSFQARDITKGDNFVSLLYYFGLLTIAGDSMGRTKMSIPNLTVAEFMHDFVPRCYEDVNGVDPRVFDIANGMADFAETGDWHKAIDTACEVVSQYLKVRDKIEGERVVQAALCSLLTVAHGPYIVQHELEVNGGYTDIAFAPQLSRYPEIGYAMLIELKYLKGKRTTKAALAKLKSAAAEQLDRYAADHDLVKKWCLDRVMLKRLAIVFQGDRLVSCAEITA